MKRTEAYGVAIAGRLDVKKSRRELETRTSSKKARERAATVGKNGSFTGLSGAAKTVLHGKIAREDEGSIQRKRYPL